MTLSSIEQAMSIPNAQSQKWAWFAWDYSHMFTSWEPLELDTEKHKSFQPPPTGSIPFSIFALISNPIHY